MKNRSAENTVAGNGSLLSLLSGKAGKIISLSLPKGAYIAAFAAFVLLSGIVSYFHEPWLDEAQSWLIARDASYHDMIFVLPHYEGHPCLWWLLLSIPAKLGAPYELSLGVVMLIISSLSAYLIMFRSPMHPLVRIMLPFTYFFFYQYGIIARPYGLMILSLLLAAHFFKDKDEKPFPYVLSLMLLCSASAYGIVLSGGLAAVWCFRILKEYGGFKGIFTKFIRTKRFASLLLLLCWAMALILSIIPVDETFTNDTMPATPLTFLRGVWYMLIMLPADSMLSGSICLSTYLKYSTFRLKDLIPLSLTGALLMAVITAFAYRKGKLPELCIPTVLLALFGALVYMITHHIGVVPVFFTFILWICCGSEDNGVPLSSRISERLPEIVPGISPADIGRLVNVCMMGLCLAVGMVCSVFSSAADITDSYFYGRDAADYIKENGLDRLNIMSSWFCENDPYGCTTVSADKQHPAVCISPYFDRNIFFNFNCGDSGKAYIFHRLSEEANEQQYALWRETVPDILVGEPRMELVYDSTDVKRADYILIKSITYTQTVKMSGAENYLCIYMRRDLFREFPGIEPENPLDREFIE